MEDMKENLDYISLVLLNGKYFFYINQFCSENEFL